MTDGSAPAPAPVSYPARLRAWAIAEVRARWKRLLSWAVVTYALPWACVHLQIAEDLCARLAPLFAWLGEKLS